MPTLAKQSISEIANKWIIKEAERLNCSKSEIVRRLLDASSAEAQSKKEQVK